MSVSVNSLFVLILSVLPLLLLGFGSYFIIVRKKRLAVILFSLGLVLLLFVLFTFSVSSYSQKEMFMDNGKRCLETYESCSCFGMLGVLDRFPPIYFCSGVEICRVASKVECFDVEILD